ncbi:predicted ATP-dependent endonuclease of the OLD family (plasmid) [Pantoea vagans C9-1]|nr:predicted ATP-dependent endonuclease of the OLD family [Pantoea vagans C9-1]
MLDSARIDTDHAAQEYTRTLYNVKCRCLRRYRLENSWRQQKDRFQELHLSAIIEEIETCLFGIWSGMRAGLEASLNIMEDRIPIRDRGKGRQCFIKTEFALRRREQHKELDVQLLEEPEKHLSHVKLKKLVSKLAQERQMQLFVATHSSHISSRLELRSAILLGKNRPVSNSTWPVRAPGGASGFYRKVFTVNSDSKRYGGEDQRGSSQLASCTSMENRTPSWRVTSSANTLVYHSVDLASLWLISVWITFCGTRCCTRCITNEFRNVFGVTGRMENVTPPRAATAWLILLRAVSSLLMSQSRAPAAGMPS